MAKQAGPIDWTIRVAKPLRERAEALTGPMRADPRFHAVRAWDPAEVARFALQRGLEAFESDYGIGPCGEPPAATLPVAPLTPAFPTPTRDQLAGAHVVLWDAIDGYVRQSLPDEADALRRSFFALYELSRGVAPYEGLPDAAALALAADEIARPDRVTADTAAVARWLRALAAGQPLTLPEA